MTDRLRWLYEIGRFEADRVWRWYWNPRDGYHWRLISKACRWIANGS